MLVQCFNLSVTSSLFIRDLYVYTIYNLCNYVFLNKNTLSQNFSHFHNNSVLQFPQMFQLIKHCYFTICLLFVYHQINMEQSKKKHKSIEQRWKKYNANGSQYFNEKWWFFFYIKLCRYLLQIALCLTRQDRCQGRRMVGNRGISHSRKNYWQC